MKNKLGLGIVLTAALSAGTVYAMEESAQSALESADSSATAAAVETAGEAQSFVQVDADNNGGLSKAEASTIDGLADRFDAADGNQDGQLDPGEFLTAVSE